MTNTIQLADIDDALHGGGINSYDVYSDYSGRAMYGETCSGLVGDFSADAVQRALFSWAEQAQEELDAGEVEYDHDGYVAQRELIENVSALGRSVRGDSMGYDTIVYFPGWVIEE
jgi:hypothetical protein